MKSGHPGEVVRERKLRDAGVAFAVALALVASLAVIGRPYAEARGRPAASAPRALAAVRAGRVAPLGETRLTSTAPPAARTTND